MTFVSPRNRLYHYCKLSTARDLVLPYYQLLLSPLKNTNDPRENKRFVFKHTYYDDPRIPDNLTWDQINLDLSEVIRDKSKVLCFCLDYSIYWGNLLSKMWAHYGDNHLGVCLELDKKNFIEENAALFDFNLFKEVFYFKFDRRNPPEHKQIDHSLLKQVGREKYLKDFRKEHLDYLFFTKNSEWESECEIRLVHFSNTNENEYCSIRNSLKNIYLGLNCKNEDIITIQNLVKGTNIEVIGTDYGDVGLELKYL